MLVDPRPVKVDGFLVVFLNFWMTASLLDGILKGRREILEGFIIFSEWIHQMDC